jgi:hypothetical protein
MAGHMAARRTITRQLHESRTTYTGRRASNAIILESVFQIPVSTHGRVASALQGSLGQGEGGDSTPGCLSTELQDPLRLDWDPLQ